MLIGARVHHTWRQLCVNMPELVLADREVAVHVSIGVQDNVEGADGVGLNLRLVVVDWQWLLAIKCKAGVPDRQLLLLAEGAVDHELAGTWSDLGLLCLFLNLIILRLHFLVLCFRLGVFRWLRPFLIVRILLNVLGI